MLHRCVKLNVNNGEEYGHLFVQLYSAFGLSTAKRWCQSSTDAAGVLKVVSDLTEGMDIICKI